MQTRLVGWMKAVAMTWVIFGAVHVAHAQAEPVGRDEEPLADGAPQGPGTTPDPSRATAEPFATLTPAPRHPLRPQRLMRSGGALIGLSLLGIIVGSSIGASSSSSCDDDEEYCFDFGPGLAAIGSAVMMAPVFLVGTILATRGARVRARHRRLRAGVQLTGGRYALSLMGRF